MNENTEEPQTNKTLNFSHGSVTLNSEQYAIVAADPFEHQRILAAAGSGKTTTITARIAWLLTNARVTADQIVLLTFSRNSAREMLHRVKRLVGPVSLWSGTFHALANTILKSMPSKESEGQQGLFFVDELPVRWMEWMRSERGRRWVGRIRYIVVDEFQDINAIQWRLLETMRHIGARMILVGDDAQNIYTWRGSSAGFLLDFHRVVPTVHDYQLRQNYRSTEAIVTVANRVMRGIPTLPWKETMVANKKGGVKPDVLFFWRVSDEYEWLAKTLHGLKQRAPMQLLQF
jgi:superfamily I DNA/RNA helicase